MDALGLDTATIAYFIAGLVGSLARVCVGTTQSPLNRRTIADVIMGAIGGMVIPWLGAGFGESIGINAADSAKFPVVIKAALIALMMYAGSHAFASILHRHTRGREDERSPDTKPTNGTPPTP